MRETKLDILGEYQKRLVVCYSHLQKNMPKFINHPVMFLGREGNLPYVDSANHLPQLMKKDIQNGVIAITIEILKLYRFFMSFFPKRKPLCKGNNITLKMFLNVVIFLEKSILHITWHRQSEPLMIYLHQQLNYFLHLTLQVKWFCSEQT